MPKKPSKYSAQFDREIKRLNKLVKIAENKGIEFIGSPVPEKPKRVTRQAVEKIHAITASDISSRGYQVDTDTGELTQYVPPKKSRRRPALYKEEIKPTKRQSKTAAPKLPKPPKPKLTPEERHKIFTESGRRSAEVRRKKAEQDPAYKARLDAARRKNLEKANAARKAKQAAKPKKPQKPKPTPEELKRKRSEAAKKAAATRKEKERTDPEYKQRMDEARRRNLQKANAAKTRKRAKEKIAAEKQRVSYGKTPTKGFITLENIKDQLSKAINKDLAAYINDCIDNIINDIGLQSFIERIEAQPDVYELVIVICFASEQEVLHVSIDTLLWMLYGGDVPSEAYATAHALAALGYRSYYA